MAEARDSDVDLDALAAAYRHRPPSDASLERARRSGSGLQGGSLILDVGGGPGHHAALWADQGHRAVIVDPAVAVTGPAGERAVQLVRGRSQALPFCDETFDLAWFHFSLHYGDWERALDEALRVVRPGGLVEVWTLADDHHDTSMLGRWFPSVPALDRERFPTAAAIEARLAAAGHTVERNHQVEARRISAGEWIAAVSAGYVSTLQLVGREELDDGLGAFATAHPHADEEVVYELRLERFVARR